MPTQTEKQGTGDLRTDLEPLIRRFPLLGDPESAQWYSGTLGTARVPGPSTYWIDAVVTVTPETAQFIEDSFELEVADMSPDIVAELRALVPPVLWTSHSFSAAVSAGGDPVFTAMAFFSPQTRQVVISALGQ